MKGVTAGRESVAPAGAGEGRTGWPDAGERSLRVVAPRERAEERRERRLDGEARGDGDRAEGKPERGAGE